MFVLNLQKTSLRVYLAFLILDFVKTATKISPLNFNKIISMETIHETKKYTRLSFWYPISYLVPASLILVFAPKFLLDNFSTGGYSIYVTRLVGAAMLGFTILVLNIVFHRVERLYDAVIYVRLPVMAIVLWLYADTKDPLFLILVLTILPGIIFSYVAKQIDKRRTLNP